MSMEETTNNSCGPSSVFDTHPFPNISSCFNFEENDADLRNDETEAAPYDFSIFPDVDLEEPFRRIIEKNIPPSDIFSHDFIINPKTALVEEVKVNVKANANSSESLPSFDESFLKRLDFLDIEESFDHFKPGIEEESFSGDLTSILREELAALGHDMPTAKFETPKIVENKITLNNDEPTPRMLSLKKDEFQFAKLLKQNDEVFEPRETVIDYPFQLDFFQRAAVVCLENREHVFVAAHTSAGKTVVAEWAIMLAVKNHRKAIYTSPIKALSNQKFRDFKERFVGKNKDEGENFSVGILTGDVQIDADASCLIMTTEILRSMLYLNSSTISEVDFVVFDEVHYISDEERGVVWEEALIMLPPSVTIVMLSATVGNAMQFANWVGGIKKRLVNVVFTINRPVPLTHYLYTGFKIKGRKEPELLSFITHDAKVNETVVRSADITLKENKDSGISKFEKLFKLLTKLKRDSLLPVIIFVFSKKQIEELCYRIKGDYTNDKHEVWYIDQFIKAKLATVKADYVGQSRQISQLKQLLVRGIGVHHSGVLPIMKEIVEMLFSKGAVKVLFATETFAMGVNMPAKSVIFTAVNKFGNIEDSTKLGRRLLRPDEYTQMAGRAGRRGLDSTGTVIIFCDRFVPHSQDLRSLTTTKLASLRSHFQVTYSMILKIFRSESQLNIEDMMGRSFSEIRRIFHHEKSLAEAENLQKDIDVENSVDVESCSYCNDSILHEYVSNSASFFKFSSQIYHNYRGKITQEWITIGRLVVLNWENFQNVLAVVVHVYRDMSIRVLTSVFDNMNCEEIMTAPPISPAHLSTNNCASSSFPVYAQTPCFNNTNLTPCLVSCRFNHFLYITRAKVPINVREADEIVASFENRAKYQNIPFPLVKPVYVVLEKVGACSASIADSIDLISLFPSKAGSGLSIEAHELKQSFETVQQYLHNFSIECNDFVSHVQTYRSKLEKQTELLKLKAALGHESLRHFEDYQERRDILKRCKYLDPRDKLTLKGKVACVISVQEVPLTETLFSNLFYQMSCAEIAAFLSIFVFQGPPSERPDVDKFVDNVCVRNVVLQYMDIREKLMAEAGISSFGMAGYGEVCVNLADTVYLFCIEASYTELINSVIRMEELGAKPVLEGDIVRCLQRVEYLVRELLAAALLIGDSALVDKFAEVHSSFKSELVFVNSLYLQS